MTHDNLEIEVKFLIDDLNTVREALEAAGATLEKERAYERNVVFDSDAETLRHREQLLRLRQDTAVKLTFKAPSEAQHGSEAKVREELEVELSDFDQMSQIIERLGFAPRLVYEKYRETWRLGEVEVVLDEMPFGDFVEFEGEETAIKRAVSDVKLEWNDRLLTNYLALMAKVKRKYRLPFDDITFENFDRVDVSIADVL